MAAYIDLNPVRANICEDRWSGYGEAVGAIAAKEALDGIRHLTEIDSVNGSLKTKKHLPQSDRVALEMWRMFLFGLPEDEGLLKARQRVPRRCDAGFYND